MSKLTSEAPVGPRKASGVRHARAGRAPRGGANRDRSNISGLSDSRPFTRGFTGGSALNRSDPEPRPENRSDSGWTPNSSASESQTEQSLKTHFNADGMVNTVFAGV